MSVLFVCGRPMGSDPAAAGGGKKGGERVAAVGKMQARFVGRSICRAPQQAVPTIALPGKYQFAIRKIRFAPQMCKALAFPYKNRYHNKGINHMEVPSMELNIGSKLSGFTVTNLRPIPGQDAVMLEMVYEKTGTELVWVKSQEPNKLFGIAFKTIPEDDTGVFHILEHSVLCGSDKYPVKEPFVELLKSSMNTFLNAMTFPDKTLYPVSSRNAQDFLNLTSVYLDAVFAPSILHNPNIFCQEGWHYELDGESLSYNGVVFNEMKGAMSSVDEVAERGMMHLLFPDNCYRYNSGGEPTAIPNLTYTQFVDTYRKNYHPTNARIYLDGDIPVEATFAMLDSYLSRYQSGEKQTLAMQVPVAQEETAFYEAANDGTPKAQLVLGKILGKFDDKVETLARQVLCDVLAGTNDAPLKRAVLETGLCQDVTLGISDGLIQPFMMLRLHNMEDQDAPKLREVIRKSAEQLVRDGIPTKQLTASINHLAFQLRQMQEPQGLIRCMYALYSWLYDGDPMQYLHFADSFDALRAMAENGGFEKLLQEMLLDETGLCVLHVLPSETYGAQLRQAELERLASEKAAMTADQLEELARIQETFTAWQQTPDTPEGLATLPVLDLSEISEEPVRCETKEESLQGVTLLRHKAASNGIVHLNAYFRLTDASLEALTQLSLLPRLLGSLPAGDMDSAALQSEIKTYLGDLRFGVEVFAKAGNRTCCTPMLAVHCSVLKENLPKAEELIHTILTATDFHQPERIREIVLQAENDAQQSGMMGGHALALGAAQSHFSAAGAAQEATRGITYIRWLHDLSKAFDETWEGFTSLLSQTLSAAICRRRLTVSLTEEGTSNISAFVSRFPEGCAAPEAAEYTTRLPKKLGVRIPAQVSYAALGYHLAEAGMAYDGTARLLSNILSLACLWNEVRVQGGAYGAGMRVGTGGSLFTYSYRDPSPSRSLGVYRSMADFVKTFASSGEDITGFIISTIAETEPLIGPAEQGSLADRDWFAGFSYEQALAERRQLLSAKTSDLARWCPVLEALREQAAVCVVGYADALNACADESLTVVDI